MIVLTHLSSIIIYRWSYFLYFDVLVCSWGLEDCILLSSSGLITGLFSQPAFYHKFYSKISLASSVSKCKKSKHSICYHIKPTFWWSHFVIHLSRHHIYKNVYILIKCNDDSSKLSITMHRYCCLWGSTQNLFSLDSKKLWKLLSN